tara:strand:- start:1511 stop:2347 length:837 start_codon:yes stop_codon:yes gene_type:complete
MSRLLKKCMVLSVGLHVLIAALLIAAATFFITKPEKVQPTLSMIAPEILDNILKPNSTQITRTPPTPAVRRNVVPQPPKQVEEAPPKTVTPKPVKITPPKKVTPKPTPRKVRTPDKPKSTQPRKIQINTSTKIVGATNPQQPAKPVPAKPNISSSALTQKVQNLRGQLSAGIKVNVSGANAVAFTSYAQFVVSVYRRTWEPLLPKNLARSRVAVVSVTIDRSGRVVSTRIIRKTGDKELDHSVQRALDRVKTIGKAFPSGSKDSKRTFTLDFTPKIRG